MEKKKEKIKLVEVDTVRDWLAEFARLAGQPLILNLLVMPDGALRFRSATDLQMNNVKLVLPGDKDSDDLPDVVAIKNSMKVEERPGYTG